MLLSRSIDPCTKLILNTKPVYVFHSIEPVIKADMQAIVEMGNQLIAENEPFALVMVSVGEDSKDREKGANAMLTQWVKESKSEL